MENPRAYRVTARSAPGGDASVRLNEQVLPIDARWGAHESNGAPGPAELLAAAFAACLMKNIERSASLLGFDYRSADVEVRAERQDAPPMFTRIRYTVRLATDEDERRVALLHRNLSKFGTVYNTLAAVCDVDGEVVATTSG